MLIQTYVLIALFVLASLLAPATAQAQTSPPDIETVACSRPVIVQPGDTLSILAARHLGSGLAYVRLFEATNAAAILDLSYATILDPNIISAGWKLCVPSETEVTPSPAAVLNPAAMPEQASTPDEDPPLWEDRLEDGGPHPLSIDYLRKQDYPGSPIVVERTLASGANYSRHIVSYLSEGLKINALMTIPFGDTPETGWPAIIFNHGYIPPVVYRPDERYVSYVDGFAANGYIVFRPDYRGHADSEGEARSAYGSPDYTIDVLNALAAVRQYPEVDADRIGMWGHSMGGYIAVRSMVAVDDIKAGVIWAGVVASYPDLMERWRGRNTNIPARARRWRTDLLDEYGTPEENPEFWDALSANSYVAELSGPIQLHHGTSDPTVPLAFSELLYQEIIDAGGDVSLYTYAGDNHNLSGYFATAMQRSLDFFDQYVKGE